jgi:hypothetical protein
VFVEDDTGILMARLLVQMLPKKWACVAVVFIAESFAVSNYEYSSGQF